MATRGPWYVLRYHPEDDGKPSNSSGPFVSEIIAYRRALRDASEDDSGSRREVLPKSRAQREWKAPLFSGENNHPRNLST